MFLEFNFTHFAGILAAAGAVGGGMHCGKLELEALAVGRIPSVDGVPYPLRSFLMSLPFFGTAAVAYCFVFKTGADICCAMRWGWLLIALCVVGAKKFDSYMYARDAGCPIIVLTAISGLRSWITMILIMAKYMMRWKTLVQKCRCPDAEPLDFYDTEVFLWII